MKNFFFVIACCFLCLLAKADTPANAFVLGNEAYKTGEFENALGHYLMAAQEVKGFAIEYNLGNTYYRLNRFPESILHYEKALKYKPANKDALHNLALANARIPDKVNKIPTRKLELWWSNFMYAPGPDGWAKISIGLSIGVVLLLLVFYISHSRILRRISFYVAIVVFIAMGLSIFFAGQAQKRWVTSTAGIVFAKKVDVKSEPLDGATTIFAVHEGTKVFIRAKEDKWYKIELSDGKEGWIQSDDVEEI